MSRTSDLPDELQAAGASQKEAAELSQIAGSLQHLRPTATASLSSQSKSRVLTYMGIGTFSGLVFGLVLVIVSLGVLPSSLLYPVQKLSDNVAISLHSEYRATVMMKHAQQVKVLIDRHAALSTVQSALADYQREATAYSATTTNYAAFDYCKSMLQQAAAHAPPNEQRAITATLATLKNV